MIRGRNRWLRARTCKIPCRFPCSMPRPVLVTGGAGLHRFDGWSVMRSATAATPFSWSLLPVILTVHRVVVLGVPRQGARRAGLSLRFTLITLKRRKGSKPNGRNRVHEPKLLHRHALGVAQKRIVMASPDVGQDDQALLHQPCRRY